MQLSPLFFDPLLFVFFFRDLFLESISGRNITDLPSKSLFTSNQWWPTLLFAILLGLYELEAAISPAMRWHTMRGVIGGTNVNAQKKSKRCHTIIC